MRIVMPNMWAPIWVGDARQICERMAVAAALQRLEHSCEIIAEVV